MTMKRQLQVALCASLFVGSTKLHAATPTPAPPAAAVAHPCAGGPHRDFDFWLGDWDVTNADGTPAGESSVTLELDGCVVHEHWHGIGSGAGFDGQSFNLYEETAKVWRQSWVDNGGQRLALLEGVFADGKMTLRGEKDTPRGHRWVKVTWSVPAPDQVRQTVESSSDGGKTWTLGFDGRYRRRAK